MNLTKNDIKQEVGRQGKMDLLADLYGYSSNDQSCLERISRLVQAAGSGPCQLFSAPGRTELGGNHTDHNNGLVLCAAVRHDALAVVRPNQTDEVVVHSEGYPTPFKVDFQNLATQPNETGTTTALIRGVLAGIKRQGGELGGFEAWITSAVGIGSGLSSSASFEVVIGTIVNHLFNNRRILAEEIARIGQFAENTYFGKPCGLMDQSASALGGILEIDFENHESIGIRKIDYDMDSTGYQLAVVNVGSDHADLTPAYAAIPVEMKSVARELDGLVLRSVIPEDLFANIPQLRNSAGDRAIQRALHYFSENRRVKQMADALLSNDFTGFLNLVGASGNSSQNLLQNIIPPMTTGREQSMALALGIAGFFFDERGRGVVRVHGGGFAGTIQAYVHLNDYSDFCELMDSVFGAGATEELLLRMAGACHVLDI